jgi:hypothetical protein
MIFLSLLDLLLSFTVLLFERLLLIGFLLAILALEYWMLTQGWFLNEYGLFFSKILDATELD